MTEKRFQPDQDNTFFKRLNESNLFHMYFGSEEMTREGFYGITDIMAELGYHDLLYEFINIHSRIVDEDLAELEALPDRVQISGEDFGKLFQKIQKKSHPHRNLKSLFS